MPKILLIRLSSIGDIVLTTPVIRCIKRQVPNCELHYLTKSHYETVLKANPHIDRLHLFNNNLKDCIKQLRKEKFDAIIDLHKNQRTFLIKAALKPCPSYTINKLSLKKWLYVNFKINLLPDLHIVNRYLAAAAPLEVRNDGLGLEYHIPDGGKIAVGEYFPNIGRVPFVAVVLGAVHFTKRLPPEKLINICELINSPVVLLGGRDVFELGEIITSKLRENRRIVNACGDLTLNQSASVIKQAEKVVTHDTGLMHIAAAFNKPIASVWGATVPAFGMFPYFGEQNTASLIAETKGLSCRPCSKIGGNNCPKKHFNCMKLIDENKIADWVNG